MTGVLDARHHLSQLVGRQIPTMTGKPNRILQISGDDVVVGTTRSPEGQHVPIEWVQNAMDRLIEERELEINPQSVGYRSAFVGAVLLTLPGVEGAINPRRVRLVDPVVSGSPLPPEPAPPSGDRSRPSSADLALALDALYRVPQRVSLSDYETLDDMSRPGLYSWWVDDTGTQHLSTGLELPLVAGLIYVGQAGATQWPSGKRRSATLQSRVSTMHLGKKISFSTLRLTLAGCLRDQLELELAGAKILSPDSEEALTRWMKDHLQIAVFGYEDVDALDELEQSVLNELDPQLNLKHMGPSPVRARLRTLRSAIAVGAEA